VAETAPHVSVRARLLNGMPAMVVDVHSPIERQSPRFTFSLALNRDGNISEIYVVSATHKLTAVK